MTKQVPVPVTALGEFSTWGRQFLSLLEAEDIISLHFEPNVATFCKKILPPEGESLVFIENAPMSQAVISQIRKTGQAAMIIWLGKSFTKEDFSFAIYERVYQVWENPKAENPVLISSLRKAEETRRQHERFTETARALKSALLQAEQEGHRSALLSEVKAAVQKLERAGGQNEFLGIRPTAGTSPLPLFSNQDLADAITVAHDLERTGVLSVSATQAEGSITFLQGQPIRAEAGFTQGAKALYRMFTWEGAKFHFERKLAEECGAANLSEDTRTIVETGKNFMRRFHTIHRECPPRHLKLKVVPQTLVTPVAFTPEQFVTLTSIISYGNVGQVLDFTELPDVGLYESLIALRKSGTITVSP